MNPRFLQIITRLDKGGAEEAVLQLIRELAKIGIYSDIAVGNVYNETILKKFPLPQNCTIHHLPQLVRNPSPIKDLQAYKAIKHLIQSHSYSLVNTHTAKAGILGRLAAHKATTPVLVHTVHGLTFGPTFSALQRLLYKSLERWVAQHTSQFIFVAKDLQDRYIQARVARKNQSSVIYVGIKLDSFRKASKVPTKTRMKIRENLGLNNDPKHLVLACIGRITPTKKQDMLIQLLPKILKENKNITLAFFGSADDKYQKKLIKLSKKLAVFPHIQFLGYIPQLWNVVPSIDIHCFASEHEGLPLTLVQTSAAGIPSLCFRCSGADEIITHNKSGFVFERSDTRGFVTALVSLIQNSSLRKKFSKEAQLCSHGNNISNWDMNNYAQKTKKIYTQLLKYSL